MPTQIPTHLIKDKAVTTAKLAAPAAKGSVLSSDGTDVVEVPVGSDDQVLTADSTESSGVAWKAGGGSIPDGSVTTAKLADGAVTLPKLGALDAKGEVLTHDGTDHVAVDVGTDGQVLSADSSEASGLAWVDPGTPTIPDGSITTAKLADDAVTTDKIAFQGVESNNIDSSAVTTSKIASNAVNNSKIANQAVDTPQLALQAVNTGQLADDAVTTSKLDDESVTLAKLDALTLKGDLIGHDGTDHTTISVGTDDQVLTADSTAPAGVTWKDAASGGGTGTSSDQEILYNNNGVVDGIPGSSWDGSRCLLPDDVAIPATTSPSFHSSETGEEDNGWWFTTGVLGQGMVIQSSHPVGGTSSMVFASTSLGTSCVVQATGVTIDGSVQATIGGGTIDFNQDDGAGTFEFNAASGVEHEFTASGGNVVLSLERSSGGHIKVSTPTGAGDVDFVLPADEGTVGQVLSTDGAGTTSWVDQAGGLSLNVRGDWTTATSYDLNDYVFNDGIAYICIADHTSAAATEPGIGADWEDEWARLSTGERDMAAGTEEAIGYYKGSVLYRYRTTYTSTSAAATKVLPALPRTPSEIMVFAGSINVGSLKVQLPYVGYAASDPFCYNAFISASFPIVQGISLSGGTAPNIGNGWVIELTMEYI